MVSSTNNFDIIEVVTINGGEASSAIVHLSGENFITEEVVSKDTRVRVWEIVGFGHGNIREITEESMHGVVLLLHIVKMFSMLVNSVATKHVFEEHECVVVFVFDTGGIVENRHVRVVHFVITDEKH